MEVVHSMYISSFMETRAQLSYHKQVIFIKATSGGLITLKGVLAISYCFYFTLRTTFNSSLVGVSEFKYSIFFSKIQLLYFLTCFSYFFSFVWLFFACTFLSFFCLFRVSYELGWSLIIVLRMFCYISLFS